MSTKQARTQALIESFRGNRDEWVMLKGVLCMAHGLDGSDGKKARDLFDTLTIAKRMDEITQALKDAFEARRPKLFDCDQ